MFSDALPRFHVTASPAAVETDLLILPAFEGITPPGGAAEVASGPADALERAVAAREITGVPFEQWWAPVAEGWRASRVLGLGAGPRDRWSPDVARRLASAGALIARQRRITDIAIVLPGAAGPTATSPRAFRAV